MTRWYARTVPDHRELSVLIHVASVPSVFHSLPLFMSNAEESGLAEGEDRLLSRMKSRLRRLRQKWRTADLGDVAERVEMLDESYVEEGARTVDGEDIETVVEEADAIEERFRNSGPLRRLLQDGRLLLGLVHDVRQGRYQQVPVWTLSAAVFALLYVLNPLDVVPDALPVLGLLDDAAVVSACLVLLEQDLYEYREWRRTRVRTPAETKEISENVSG